MVIVQCAAQCDGVGSQGPLRGIALRVAESANSCTGPFPLARIHVRVQGGRSSHRSPGARDRAWERNARVPRSPAVGNGDRRAERASSEMPSNPFALPILPFELLCVSVRRSGPPLAAAREELGPSPSRRRFAVGTCASPSFVRCLPRRRPLSAIAAATTKATSNVTASPTGAVEDGAGSRSSLSLRRGDTRQN